MLSKKNLQLSWHLTPVCVFFFVVDYNEEILTISFHVITH